MHRREGFTLIELLIVVVIIGILAAIAANMFWQAKEQAFKTALISDLKVLSLQQEQYHAEHMTYTSDEDALNYAATEGVDVTILSATATGWSAQAVHASMPDRPCGILMGDATDAGDTPAVTPGVISCN